MAIIIRTFDKLNEWLSQNNFFQDGCILDIKSNPLEIIVGYTVYGNYKANSEKHILSFKLIPSKIFEWSYTENLFIPGEDTVIDGIDAIESDTELCLEFHTPEVFRLTTDSLEIQEQPILKTTFIPRINEREIYLDSDLQDIPTPAYWIQKLKDYGHDILFRYYDGEAKQIDEVPYSAYEGYYMQLVNRINSTKEGIFVQNINKINGKVRLSFFNKDEQLIDVFTDLTKILADFPNAQIRSGNCEFTGSEWKEYLLTHRLD